MDVEGFLRLLVPNEHVEPFLDSKPNNLPPRCSPAYNRLLREADIPLRKAFANASVRFTHFIRIADDVHVDLAWAALCRGAAVVCHDAQETVDIVIPVVYNRDKRMFKQEITAIFIRCKLRTGRHTPTAGTDAGSIRFFGSGQLPYIAVTMDLGEGQAEIEYPPQPASTSGGIPEILSEVHPRYAIAVRGCSSHVYAAVDPEEETLYWKLLGNSMLAKHARRGIDNLDAVRRLMPLWSSGEASLDWVERGTGGQV